MKRIEKRVSEVKELTLIDKYLNSKPEEFLNQISYVAYSHGNIVIELDSSKANDNSYLILGEVLDVSVSTSGNSEELVRVVIHMVDNVIYRYVVSFNNLNISFNRVKLNE